MPDPAENQTPSEAPAPAEAAPVVAPADPVVAPEAPAADPAAPAPVLTRPEGLDDKFWDDKTGLKVGDVVATLRETQAKLDEIEAAKGEVPTDIAGYELKLPEDVKLPEGMTLELDAKDPFLAEAQAYAKEQGWTKGQWNQSLALYARQNAAEFTAARATLGAELAKLGDNAKARIEAARNYLGANLKEGQAQALLGNFYTADQLQAVEALIALKSGPSMAGGGGNTNTGKPQHIADQLYAPYPPQPRK